MYKNTCRGLFERHKLLFAFQMCIKILEGEKKVQQEEYQFFLRGGIVVNRDSQPPNPAHEWLSEIAWDNITELDKIPAFRDIGASFEQNPLDWKKWYESDKPESTPLIGEWENKCNEFHRLIMVRCIRPDRVVTASRDYILNNMPVREDPKRFIEPPPFDLAQSLADSVPSIPLIFVLSPGVDPVNGLAKLASEKGFKLKWIALGQGQSTIAERMLSEGMKEGQWVFLANCHLSLSWMPKLEKIVESIPGKSTNEHFRLWLSSSPTPDFPITILQAGIKMTTEPPKGLKANLIRLYNRFTAESIDSAPKPHVYKKLLFALCFFHAILLERRKFLCLGWNIPYDFNESDFEFSEQVLRQYLHAYEETPWDALRYLIAEANYGGRVTDDMDRRVLKTYMDQFFSQEAVSPDPFPLSKSGTYYIPEDTDLQGYKNYIQHVLPTQDDSEAFGQHPNADISSQVEETNVLLDTILSLQVGDPTKPPSMRLPRPHPSASNQPGALASLCSRRSCPSAARRQRTRCCGWRTN